MKSAGEELRLVVGPNGVPRWVVKGKRRPRPEIHEDDIRNHIAILLDDPRKRSKHS
jgi:hypothetical protein